MWIDRDYLEVPDAPEPEGRPRLNHTVATGGTPGRELDWIIDTGATHHAACRRELFSKYTQFQEDLAIDSGGAGCVAEGKGTVELSLSVPGTTPRGTTLVGVLYVPSLPTNLLSVAQVNRLRVGFQILDNGDCLFSRQAAGGYRTVIATGSMLKNAALWRLDLSVSACLPLWAGLWHTCPPQIMLMGGARAQSLKRWHERLGHLGATNTREVARLTTGIKFLNEDESYHCPSCIAGTQRASGLYSEPLRAQEVLDQIYVDVEGYVDPPTKAGERYILLIVDDKTRFSWPFFMKSREGLWYYVKLWVNWAERCTGRALKVIRADNEFQTKAGRDWMLARGIKFEPTAPYTPRQNGVVERKGGVVFNGVRSIIFDANLPKELWAEVAATVIYLRNRCPTRAVRGMTPLEAWSGRKPDLSHLRRVGCRAYKLVPKATHPKKLQERGQQRILVGYGGAFQYRLWNPYTGGIERASEVVFDEDSRFSIDPRDLKLPQLSPREAAPPAAEECLPHAALARLPQEDVPYAAIRAELRQKEEEQWGPSAGSALPEEVAWRRLARHEGKNDDGTYADALHLQALDEDDPERPNVERQLLYTDIATGADPDPGVDSDDEWDTKELEDEYRDCPNASLLNLAPPADVDKDEPQTLRQAKASPDWPKWKKAMEEELHQLHINNTWEEVPARQAPAGQVLGGKWVFKIKRGSENQITRWKARWVVRGFEQVLGINYHETFASVVKPMSYKALFAIAAARGWVIEQMDVKTAFLYGEVDAEIYVEMPHEFGKPNTVCFLRKALYGLKQAPRIWKQTLAASLAKLGLVESETDTAVFKIESKIPIGVFEKSGVIVVVYVDDLLLFGPDIGEVNRLKRRLEESFQMSDLGPCAFFLGIKVERDLVNKTIRLSQEAYIDTILRRFGYSDVNTKETPAAINTILEPAGPDTPSLGQAEIREYQSKVGSLMFLMQGTRPDIAFAISMLSRFCANPTKEHVTAAKRVFCYLKRTKSMALIYRGHESLEGFTDSDFAGEKSTSKSTGGYAILLGGAAISWSSKRQPIIAGSTTEAEYVGMYFATKEALWIRRLLREFGVKAAAKGVPMKFFGDNNSANVLAHNPEMHQKSKHIRNKYHLVRQNVAREKLDFQHVAGEDNTADIFTKPLGSQKFYKFVKALGLSAPEESDLMKIPKGPNKGKTKGSLKVTEN